MMDVIYQELKERAIERLKKENVIVNDIADGYNGIFTIKGFYDNSGKCTNSLNTSDQVELYLESIFGPETKNQHKLHTINLEQGCGIHIHPDFIKKVFVNLEERIVVVLFSNDEKEIVKCSENDDFDVTIGVALAVCRHLFGHTNFYKKIVGKKTYYQQKREKKVANNDYVAYLKWCEANKKRKVAEATFKKNKYKYLARMKGEN